MYINAVYYPSWRIYKGLPPSSMRLECITHILYAFILANPDGSLRKSNRKFLNHFWSPQPLDEWADTGIQADGSQGCLAALASLKREAPHIRTLISVGGGSGSAEFPALAGNPEARARFAGEVRAFVDRWGMDGVDIDWEHPSTPQQGRDYISLLQDLRAVLPPPYLLTSALPIGEYAPTNIHLPTAARLLSYINLMAYDFSGPWTDISGHHAQLMPHPGDPSHTYPALRTSGAGGVEYLLRHGIPSQKIILGVPAYARNFGQARGPGQPFRGAGEMDYCDLDGECLRNARVDVVLGSASYVHEGFVDAKGNKEDSKGFMSFDVPETVRMKARYAKAMGLGGLFYWTGVGDRCGEESLVAAGFDELTSG